MKTIEVKCRGLKNRYCELIITIPSTIDDVDIDSIGICYACKTKGKHSLKIVVPCPSCGRVITYCYTCKQAMGAKKV